MEMICSDCPYAIMDVHNYVCTCMSCVHVHVHDMHVYSLFMCLHIVKFITHFVHNTDELISVQCKKCGIIIEIDFPITIDYGNC